MGMENGTKSSEELGEFVELLMHGVLALEARLLVAEDEIAFLKGKLNRALGTKVEVGPRDEPTSFNQRPTRTAPLAEVIEVEEEDEDEAEDEAAEPVQVSASEQVRINAMMIAELKGMVRPQS